MPDYSDRSPEAAEIADGQRIRLRRLREVLTPYQAEAARAAGVSNDSWNNMELGRSRISIVALARFCAAFGRPYGGLPTEYVTTGRLSGLPDNLVRQILELEKEEAAGPPAEPSEGGTSEPAGQSPSGKPKRRRKDGRRVKPVG
jgi:transcriptional regulator with XRE-family HTH domain